ncbi:MULTISPECIES: SCO4402 family protein [Streptomyces]|uniref:SCO4402 family protein n=1 Tax=Streptomyces TaxID=1883 RepID=UPI0038D4BE8A
MPVLDRVGAKRPDGGAALAVSAPQPLPSNRNDPKHPLRAERISRPLTSTADINDAGRRRTPASQSGCRTSRRQQQERARQRDVWLDPSTFENLDHIFHTLFDDFCDADEPERYLGTSLRTEEEVALMRELGAALNAAANEAPNDTDAEYLQAASWPVVVAVAGRLAQVMVR